MPVPHGIILNMTITDCETKTKELLKDMRIETTGDIETLTRELCGNGMKPADIADKIRWLAVSTPPQHSLW